MTVNKLDKVIEIQDSEFSLEDSNNKVNIYPFTCNNDNIIAGEFYFKPNNSRSRHCIMLASRFNRNSAEENGPFPGWFVQIVGNSLSIGIGNGKTWQSVVSSVEVVNNKWHHVAFSLNNNTKIGELYVNGILNMKNNITFRKPCQFLTVGALNMKGEFRFDGEISDIKIGNKLVEKKKEVIEVKSNDVNEYIEKSNEYLLKIKNNLQNVSNDIESLKDVKNKITSWKYRGLQLDTSLLDTQIEDYIRKKSDFEKDTKDKAEKLSKLDYKINPIEDTIDRNNYIEFYKICLNNLKTDLDILNDAVNNLLKFKNLGVELGSSFKSIDEQKEEIISTIKEATEDLKIREIETFKMMEIIKLNDE
jgi:hypothetical protein